MYRECLFIIILFARCFILVSVLFKHIFCLLNATTHGRTLLTGTYFMALVGMLIYSNSVTMDSDSVVLDEFSLYEVYNKNVSRNDDIYTISGETGSRLYLVALRLHDLKIACHNTDDVVFV